MSDLVAFGLAVAYAVTWPFRAPCRALWHAISREPRIKEVRAEAQR